MSSDESNCGCEWCGEDYELEECAGPGCVGGGDQFCEECLEGCTVCGRSVCLDKECSYSCRACGLLFCQWRRCSSESICTECNSTMMCPGCINEDKKGCCVCQKTHTHTQPAYLTPQPSTNNDYHSWDL